MEGKSKQTDFGSSTFYDPDEVFFCGKGFPTDPQTFACPHHVTLPHPVALATLVPLVAVEGEEGGARASHKVSPCKRYEAGWEYLSWGPMEWIPFTVYAKA